MASNEAKMTLEERITQRIKDDTLMAVVGDEDAINELVRRSLDEAARRMGIPLAGNDSDREETFNWGWPMLEVRETPNVPCRGYQGVWELPGAVAAEIA